ncbi:MAG: universal stress protein [Phenylobacterium sp.]|uniref:universal stress protein n=1 Tax=Phenylobacterium sp. TaxID=1871053 RepID=UPI003BB6E90E
MSYKTLLVHAEADLAAAPRLATAAALAKRLDAALLGLGAEMYDWMAVSDPYGFAAPDWTDVVRRQVEVDLQAAERLFRQAAAAVQHDWGISHEAPALALARRARAADLIIAGGAPLDGAASLRAADTADLIMTSGRPVLVAPPTGGELRAERIVVAWKDGREARRAVADALPLLKRAEEVVVMATCAAPEMEDAQAATAAVAQHLKSHGVTARACARIAPADRAGVELNIEAQALGADLIVAGAYGHSRVREWLLGGVTHTLLHQPERFVLFSH